MSATTWDTARDEELRALCAEGGLRDRDLAEHFGVGDAEVIRRARRRLGLTKVPGFPRLAEPVGRVVKQEGALTVFAPDRLAAEDPEVFFEQAARVTDREVAKIEAESLVRVRIETEKPIALTLSSDWHLTASRATRLRELRTYCEATRDADGVYAALIGDQLDNTIKWSPNMDDVPREVRLADFLLGILADKLIGMTSGNHDDWTGQYAGLDALEGLAKAHRVHYAPDELIYQIELVDPRSQEVTARYTVATRHQYNRNSQLNWTHACWRWLEDRQGQWPLGEDGGVLVPDILALGHSHVASLEERVLEHKPIWACRTGPWKAGSTHQRRYGFSRIPATAPTFLLYPERAEPIMGFSDYAQAYRVLAQERARW